MRKEKKRAGGVRENLRFPQKLWKAIKAVGRRQFVVWHPTEYYRLFWELCGSQNSFELSSARLPGIKLPSAIHDSLLWSIILSEPVNSDRIKLWVCCLYFNSKRFVVLLLK